MLSACAALPVAQADLAELDPEQRILGLDAQSALERRGGGREVAARAPACGPARPAR